MDAEVDFDYAPSWNIAPEGPGVPAVENENPDTISRHHLPTPSPGTSGASSRAGLTIPRTSRSCSTPAPRHSSEEFSAH